MKGKSIIQPSQDNCETTVKKLEKGSTVQSSCNQVHNSNKSKPQARKEFGSYQVFQHGTLCFNVLNQAGRPANNLQETKKP
jgi:hypothetical protein